MTMKAITVAEIKDIPLDKLEINKSQVRLSEVGADIEELASSIKAVGLLEPILVCPGPKHAENGKYEILLGQRRFLAHKMNAADTIRAQVMSSRPSEIETKIISLTENFERRDLPIKDLIEVCTFLYRKFGSLKIVSDSTGIPETKIRDYIKYDRLIQPLKELVDKGLDINTALNAQDSATINGIIDEKLALQMAQELKSMTPTQRKAVKKEKARKPAVPLEKIVEGVKSGDGYVNLQIIVGKSLHSRLKDFAKDEKTDLADAATTLIDDSLESKGYSESED